MKTVVCYVTNNIVVHVSQFSSGQLLDWYCSSRIRSRTENNSLY